MGKNERKSSNVVAFVGKAKVKNVKVNEKKYKQTGIRLPLKLRDKLDDYIESRAGHVSINTVIIEALVKYLKKN